MINSRDIFNNVLLRALTKPNCNGIGEAIDSAIKSVRAFKDTFPEDYKPVHFRSQIPVSKVKKNAV